jgi:hypothetical protein
MTLELLDRNRVRPLPGAAVRPLASNAWEIRIPRTPDAERVFGPGLRKLDGAVFLVDGVQTEPALISAETADAVLVSAWALP